MVADAIAFSGTAAIFPTFYSNPGCTRSSRRYDGIARYFLECLYSLASVREHISQGKKDWQP